MKRQAWNELEAKIRTAAGLMEQSPLSPYHRQETLLLLQDCLRAMQEWRPAPRVPRNPSALPREPLSPVFERFIRSQERRAFRRWTVRLPALCTSPRGVEDCTVVDLSEAGLAMQVERSLRVGTEVVLDCPLEPDHSKRIHLFGAVRHARENVVAVEYLHLTASDRVRITDFVLQHANPDEVAAAQ